MLRSLLWLEKTSWRMAFESAQRTLGGYDFIQPIRALRPDVVLPLADGARVLDVGCGGGWWSRELATVAREVVGVDHQPSVIEYARAHTTATNVTYRVGDASDAADGESFDLAILIHVLEHVEDPTGLLRSMHGVARKIAVEVPDFESDPLNRARLAIGEDYSSDADHVREYTLDLLREQLQATGWEPISFHYGGKLIGALAEPRA